MTAATTIERSGPAIRATLAELAPAERKEFETEQERELVVQARAGVDTGWYVRQNDRWVQL